MGKEEPAKGPDGREEEGARVVREADRVLDAYGLLAYFQGEAGEETMIEVFLSAKRSGRLLLLSTVNWGEVFYSTVHCSIYRVKSQLPARERKSFQNALLFAPEHIPYLPLLQHFQNFL